MVGLQALDFYQFKTSDILERIKQKVREKVPFLTKDSRLDEYFKDIVKMIDSGALLKR